MTSANRLIILTGFLLAAGSVLLVAEEPDAPKKSYEQYQVIYERNIFSKDRLPPRERTGPERVRQTQVLSIYVLRGIAGKPGRRVVFIEEQISGQTQRAELGSELLDGTITEIKYDRVAFERDGQTRYIKVGGEFGKTETTVLTAAPEATAQEGAVPADTAGPQTAPADSNAPNGESDILKKLMERRKNELGQ
jgi:type II secretory pathway component PulC